MDMSTLQSTELEKSSVATSSMSLRVPELLALCSSSVELEDFKSSESYVMELVNLLGSLSDEVASDPDNKELENNIFQDLTEILASLSSPQLDQTVLDTLSFELPKAVSKFVGVSERCSEIADNIVDRFIATCSPRDMLSVLCEALDSPDKGVKTSSYSTPLLHGLSKVFLSITRRHYEQLKVAVPIILKVFREISSETEMKLNELFDEALAIANSIHGVCMKLIGKDDEKVRALLGLYVLQIVVFISLSIRDKLANCLPLMTQLAPYLTYCGISYNGLITGCDVERMKSIVAGGDEDDYMSYFSDVELGASLSVIWSKISDGVANADNADLRDVVSKLQNDRVQRWQAYGTLKHVLTSGSLQWEFRKHAVELLLEITHGVASAQCTDEQLDCSSYTPSLFATLQAITMSIIYAQDKDLRKKSFDALKKILADIPPPQRFEILRALVTNSKSPSMTAILLDLVKANMHEGSSKDENCVSVGNCVLELVEFVLRPPEGGPPSLPEQGDAVLAALNLYRFALLTESRGTDNCQVLVLKTNLHKVLNEWLLPLRTLVSCLTAQHGNGHDELSNEIVCSLNPIELVLYRCIELTEEKLESSA